MSDEDWQSNCKVIKDRGDHILNHGTWADCHFLVGRETQRNFSAHKLILAMASPVFEAMLYGRMAEKEVIHIPDIQPEHFETMLRYIYSDKITLRTCDDATALFYCAEKYIMPNLRKGCIDSLIANLKPENACKMYELAKMFDVFDLLERCIQMIEIHPVKVLNYSSFLEAKLSTVLDIFSFFQMNIDSELELFKAAERYAKANCNNTYSEIEEVTETKDKEIIKDGNKQSDSDSESTEIVAIEPGDNEHKIFRKLIEKLHLLSLTPQQFAEEVAHSPYITTYEALALITNTASINTVFSVPQGFTNIRRPRYKIIIHKSLNIDLSGRSNKCRPIAMFRFTVPKFGERCHISLPFYARNLAWRIGVNPPTVTSESIYSQKNINIFLCCNYIGKSSTWSCQCEVSFHLVSKFDVVHNIEVVHHKFTSVARYCGLAILEKFVSNSNNGFVNDNGSITIEVVLTTLPVDK